MPLRSVALAMAFGLPLLGVAIAQDRDTKVRNDRENFAESKEWVYNDLEAGLEAARSANKPLMVVFRCIPCEACQKFDDDVARRDPIIRDLLDEFVCVRIIQANVIDLAHFQYDFDLSFAVVFINADKTIYGRFGTRSDRPEAEDISLRGLREAMAEALRLHRNFESVRSSLEGKQVKDVRFKTPRDYPTMSNRYGANLDYEGKVAQSCMHCHQIRDAERDLYRAEKSFLPDRIVFPYPDPEVLGLKLDPARKATIERVAAGSVADQAGLRPGDQLLTMDRQPLLSIADVQWVLHNQPAEARLAATVDRDGKVMDVVLPLKEGWRRGNISWRTTTWNLRRMGLGGLRLDELTDAERKAAKLTSDTLALRVKWAGEFGPHGVAKRAGVLKGDIIIAFDGQTKSMSESELIAYAIQRKRPRDRVSVTLLRDGATKVVTFLLQ